VIALTALVLVLTVLLLVCLFALMDQYRTLELVRDHLGINDSPRPLTFPSGEIVPSEAGLPAHLDGADHLVVLFLSTSCTTCKTVANALRGKRAEGLHVVVRSRSEALGREWAQEAGLAPDAVTVAADDHIADAFELRVTPAVFVLRGGHIALAQTVPSARQLEPLLAGPLTLPRRDEEPSWTTT
jgi:hypothetical protein